MERASSKRYEKSHNSEQQLHLLLLCFNACVHRRFSNAAGEMIVASSDATHQFPAFAAGIGESRLNRDADTSCGRTGNEAAHACGALRSASCKDAADGYSTRPGSVPQKSRRAAAAVCVYAALYLAIYRIFSSSRIILRNSLAEGLRPRSFSVSTATG